MAYLNAHLNVPEAWQAHVDAQDAYPPIDLEEVERVRDLAYKIPALTPYRYAIDDLVRYVGWHATPEGADHLEALHPLEPLAELGGQVRLDLDGGNTPAVGQQAFGQGSVPGADLDHAGARLERQTRRNPLQDALIA